ncbi:hypothetical protein [Sphaerospermopsis aphanizomenoides]|nr:hypothetical protein [Sphaerospermopsis aphanizomenoides]
MASPRYAYGTLRERYQEFRVEKLRKLLLIFKEDIGIWLDI